MNIWFASGEGNDEIFTLKIGGKSGTEVKAALDRNGVQFKTIGQFVTGF